MQEVFVLLAVGVEGFETFCAVYKTRAAAEASIVERHARQKAQGRAERRYVIDPTDLRD